MSDILPCQNNTKTINLVSTTDQILSPRSLQKETKIKRTYLRVKSVDINFVLKLQNKGCPTPAGTSKRPRRGTVPTESDTAMP